MSDYTQPEFYRFNEDSLRLVNFVTTRVNSAWNLLDLGAGCGVIGLELAKLLKPAHVTMVELQEEFKPFLEENMLRHNPHATKFEVVYSSFGKWAPLKSYDLVVANPPYYLPGHGEPSSDHSRDLARSFKLDGWRVFLELILKSLATNGKAFLVINNNQLLIKEIRHYLPTQLNMIEHREQHLVYVELVRLNKN